MRLAIKNMVCARCELVVKQQLVLLGFNIDSVGLGWAVVSPEPDNDQLTEIASALQIAGFELIDDQRKKLVEMVKNEIVKTIQYSDLTELNVNFSSLLADRLNRPYSFLSSLFSEEEQKTIEHYIIEQKVEKIKELIDYGELNLNEIAYQMGYSSSAHLSAQFKKVTGLSPSKYKTAELPRRGLDQL